MILTDAEMIAIGCLAVDRWMAMKQWVVSQRPEDYATFQRTMAAFDKACIAAEKKILAEEKP